MPMNAIVVGCCAADDAGLRVDLRYRIQVGIGRDIGALLMLAGRCRRSSASAQRDLEWRVAEVRTRRQAKDFSGGCGFMEFSPGYAAGALIGAEVFRTYLLEEIVMDRKRLDMATTMKGAALAGAAAAVSLGIAITGAGTAAADTEDGGTTTSRQSAASSSSDARDFGSNLARNLGKFGTNLVQNTGKVGTNAQQQLGQAGTNALINSGTVADNLVDNVSETGGNVFGNVNEAGGNLVGNAGEAGGNLVGNAGEAGGNLVGNAGEAGGNLVDNIGDLFD
ncbi:hypothetical protein [Mycolicibacterium sp. P9-22]|uniref:hypothetical protein n=1 Tax=Mycolicibacterium sp. P9-22 TaxID=2024613 RepID=UPI0018842FFE|nr:hypothetical protein [Mycolicibacterium sp. P9-22]